MKKIILACFLSLAAFWGASAQTLNFLTFTATDGSKTSVPATGLKITFSNGNLVATSTSGTQSLALSALSEMAFTSSNLTGILFTQSPAELISMNGNILTVNAPLHTAIKLYSLTGQLVGNWSAPAGESRFSLNLPAGIYIVKTGSTSSKIQVK